MFSTPRVAGSPLAAAGPRDERTDRLDATKAGNSSSSSSSSSSSRGRSPGVASGAADAEGGSFSRILSPRSEVDSATGSKPTPASSSSYLKPASLEVADSKVTGLANFSRCI